MKEKMRKLFTIGFSKKNAQEFFETLKKEGVELVVDVRVNNKSQISGYAKYPDLPYFLKIYGISYIYLPELSPDPSLLSSFRRGKVTWDFYKKKFLEQLSSNKESVYSKFLDLFRSYSNICLLCSENDYRRCHRNLIAEFLVEELDVNIVHIVKERNIMLCKVHDALYK